ncbi:C-type lectin domain family 4 member F-like [Ctenopharyngodon idella]|uniref:C-type lectin domain family 4 member F-like n=1 Tax=Ctenopharyngodon idella TaxID=7959 RepID=UPI002232BACD|nr:C-type lectin domain family 4 member F-like [Ctenopharyngodon idella]
MDSINENSGFMLLTVASDEECSQYKGFSTEKQQREVIAPKCTKVLLTLLGFSLFFALGGLCAFWILYNHNLADFESLNEQHIMVSEQLAAQEINSTVMIRELEELKTNYTRVREQLLLHVALKKEFNDLTARYNTFREWLSFNDDGWIVYHGKLYLFSSDQLNWWSSRDVCISKGADLVTITNQSEQDFLVSKINVTHWIGLHDLDTEGHWVWVLVQRGSKTT